MKMKGMGRVFQRGSVWWVAYSYRGKEFRESANSARPSEARKLLKKRLGDIGKGPLLGTIEEKVTFEQLADDIICDYEINGKRSLPGLKLSIAHLRSVFGLDRALDITTDRIKVYISQRQKEMAEKHRDKAKRNITRTRTLKEKAKALQGTAVGVLQGTAVGVLYVCGSALAGRASNEFGSYQQRKYQQRARCVEADVFPSSASR